MARLLLTVLLLPLALLALVLCYLQFADLNRHRALLEAAVAEATGRDFAVEDVELELWPAVRFVATTVSRPCPLIHTRH